MGFSAKWTVMPIALLIVSIAMSGLSISSVGATGTYYTGNCGSNCNVVLGGGQVQNTGSVQTINCSSYTNIFGTPCIANFAAFTGTITCAQTNVNGCFIASGCPANFVNSGGLFCNQFENNLICDPGCIGTVNSGQGTGNVAYQTYTTYFTSILSGSDGFIAWIGIAIATIGILGLTIVGSGLSDEAQHDILYGAALLGIWIFFSSIEGFITGYGGSFFIQLNNFLNGLGTGFYFILTLIYFVGVLKALDRGF